MFNKLKIKLLIKPGDGGDGSVACSPGQRNSFIYHGGNGGNGGNIILKYQNTFLINNNLKNNIINGHNGANGKIGKKDGKHGQHQVVYLSRLSNIHFLNSGKKIQITATNRSYTIYGGRGGLGSRTTKNRIFMPANKGAKTRRETIEIAAILPIGILMVIDAPVGVQRRIIRDKFGLNIHKLEEIICINKYNHNIYILPFLSQKNSFLQQHFEKVTLAFVYSKSSWTDARWLKCPIYFIHQF